MSAFGARALLGCPILGFTAHTCTQSVLYSAASALRDCPALRHALQLPVLTVTQHSIESSAHSSEAVKQTRNRRPAIDTGGWYLYTSDTPASGNQTLMSCYLLLYLSVSVVCE